MTIAVYLESFEGKLPKASKGAAGAAKLLADKRGDSEIIGIVIDDKAEDTFDTIKELGISKVKYGTEIDGYQRSLFAQYVIEAAGNADVIVFPGTSWGQEVGTDVTVRNERTPVTDVVGIEDANRFKRSIHGNSVISYVEADGKLAITVRTGVFDFPEENVDNLDTEHISASADGLPTVEVVEISELDRDRIPLTEADVVVSGGRGVGSEEKFEIIDQLADLLNAAVGATRPVVDNEWRPTSIQVGQTGKFVSPSLYIAAGISGAVQHLTGMSTSDVIVAINTDEEAPIFDIADYGIVEDLHEVIPMLIEKIKKHKEES